MAKHVPKREFGQIETLILHMPCIALPGDPVFCHPLLVWPWYLTDCSVPGQTTLRIRLQVASSVSCTAHRAVQVHVVFSNHSSGCDAPAFPVSFSGEALVSCSAFNSTVNGCYLHNITFHVVLRKKLTGIPKITSGQPGPSGQPDSYRVLLILPGASCE